MAEGENSQGLQDAGFTSPVNAGQARPGTAELRSSVEVELQGIEALEVVQLQVVDAISRTQAFHIR